MAYLSNHNSTTLSVPSLSASGVVASGGGDHNLSVSDQFSGEIDKAIAQLKYKNSIKNDNTSQGNSASIYSSAGVSQVVALVCGLEKNELDTRERQTLKDLELFFKEFIKETNVSGGIKLKEGFNQLFHNPEYIVFQDLLLNEPVEWSKLVLPILLDNQQKEAWKEKILAEIQEFQLKRRELSKDAGLEKKRLQEMQTERKEKQDKIHADNIRRIDIGLESYKSEADKIEDMHLKCGEVLTNSKVEDLLSRFEETKLRRENLKEELNRLSANGSLPPNANDALSVLESRKAFLDALLDRITNLASNDLNISSRSSLENSVFNRKSSAQ